MNYDIASSLGWSTVNVHSIYNKQKVKEYIQIWEPCFDNEQDINVNSKKGCQKMIPGSVWICGSSHIVCVFHILREVRAHLKDVGL